MALGILAAGLGIAVLTDVRSRRIPNLLTGSMAAAGLALAALGFSGITVVASLSGLGLGLLLMVPGHALGATGAGDVKLMAAVGSIVGPALVIPAFLYTCIAGGVIAIVVAICRRRLAATVATTGRMIAAPSNAAGEIRAATAASRFAYGPAIAVGSLLAFLIA